MCRTLVGNRRRFCTGMRRACWVLRPRAVVHRSAKLRERSLVVPKLVSGAAQSAQEDGASTSTTTFRGRAAARLSPPWLTLGAAEPSLYQAGPSRGTTPAPRLRCLLVQNPCRKPTWFLHRNVPACWGLSCLEARRARRARGAEPVSGTDVFSAQECTRLAGALRCSEDRRAAGPRRGSDGSRTGRALRASPAARVPRARGAITVELMWLNLLRSRERLRG